MVKLNEQAVDYTDERFSSNKTQNSQVLATYYTRDYTQTDVTKHINPAAHTHTGKNDV